MDHTAALKRAAEVISGADYLLITGGAGLSADSGLPVFAALSAHPVLQAAGMSYDQVVCGNTLARDPAFFFGFYASAAGAYEAAQPHAGYQVLKALVALIEGKRGVGHVQVLTTNVDGMLRRVGVPAIQLHGSATRFQCGGRLNSTSRFPLSLGPRCAHTWPAPLPASFQVDASTLRARTLPSPCPQCGGVARPNIYLFGDGNGFAEDLAENEQWRVWRDDTARVCKEGARLVVLEIGAGLRVPVLRKRAEELCVQVGANATLIRVNPDYSQQCIVSPPPPPTSIISLPIAALPALQDIAKRLDLQV
eukprot:Mycagemm_TRINITY_DN10948_c0_g1::TRINITY_DN10948_c0_g1_i1::g.381::m.381 type:complete len:307 gc:universal TRINITY_DN10948_c0_g1_i1:62-982(+)